MKLQNDIDETLRLRDYQRHLSHCVHLTDILTDAPLDGFVYPAGPQKFAYRDEHERKLLLHAFSQIPIEMVTATSVHNLTQPTEAYHGDGLEWLYTTRFTADPLLPYHSNGYYSIFYNTKTRLYALHVMWSEEIGVGDETVRAYALNIKTQTDVLKLLRDARTVGIEYWLKERRRIKERRDAKHDKIHDMLDKLP